MRILLIGGTGFIGPYVARELADRGHDLTLFHRGQHESPLLSSIQHFRSAQAAIPVLNFPMGEADARAAVRTFAGRVQRLVALSSGDVYRAYGRFSGLEPGPAEQGLLTEDSPLRSILYPYRSQAKSQDELFYFYDKILVERHVLGQALLPATVLRLPKVYGPGGNADLATIYGYRNRSGWRWTHGYVENVAAAIALAALHPAAANRVYNVGEVYTPSVAERLEDLPSSPVPVAEAVGFDFRNDIAYDTTRIRKELGYVELVSYEEGLKRTLDTCRAGFES
jgi:nucleoside-diphosphate-sugar epimerase